jgi:hypothetical protein
VMRSDTVVLPEPNIDNSLCLIWTVEPSSIHGLSSECAVETVVAPVLPRTTWLDMPWLEPIDRMMLIDTFDIRRQCLKR